MVKAYLRYLWQRKDEYGIHAPFLYNLYTEIIKPDEVIGAFSSFEEIRNELRKNQNTLKVTDYGAGSKKSQKTIANIANSALARPKYSRLLYRLINHQKPKTIFELGTSLGINSLYMSQAWPSAKMYTFEGCPEISRIAKQQFDRVSAKNIVQVVGNLDVTLEDTLRQIDRLDFVFFDANHRYEPTLKYFELCLSTAHSESIFVFDDIHWSQGMEQAWAHIKDHPQVDLSLDLFQFGIIFFRKKQAKEHFVLKY